MTDFSRNPDDLGPEADSPSAPPRRRGLFFTLLALPRWLVSRFGLMVLGAAVVGGLVYLASQGGGFVKQSELSREKAKLEGEIEALRAG